MAFRREVDLERAAEPFLKANGYTYAWQVPIHNRVLDLAAIHACGDTIGIEFKISNWKRALKQARTHRRSLDFVYVCLPGGKYNDKLIEAAREDGIGVLLFDESDGTVREQLPARRSAAQWLPNLDAVRQYIEERGNR